jgi:hypothetical protein
MSVNNQGQFAAERRERRAIDDRLRTSPSFVQESVPCNFSYQLRRGESLHFDQCSGVRENCA